MDLEREKLEGEPNGSLFFFVFFLVLFEKFDRFFYFTNLFFWFFNLLFLKKKISLILEIYV